MLCKITIKKKKKLPAQNVYIDKTKYKIKIGKSYF